MDTEPASVKRNWSEWHNKYDAPGSDLAARLVAVQNAIHESIEGGAVSIIDICAGDARDIVGALRGDPSAARLHGLLVEIDPALAAKAKTSLQEANLKLDVVVADAADTSLYKQHAPADLVLLCGVFGNISKADIIKTIQFLPHLCKPGGTVIWTRNRREPDITPWIRDRFNKAGFDENNFIGPAGTTYGVGVATFNGETPIDWASTNLFKFIR